MIKIIVVVVVILVILFLLFAECKVSKRVAFKCNGDMKVYDIKVKSRLIDFFIEGRDMIGFEQAHDW